MNVQGYYRQHWEEKRLAYDRIRAKGEVRTIVVGKRLHVICPKDETFRKLAMEMGAEWHPKIGVWSFPGTQRRLIALLIIQIYGEEKLPPELEPDLERPNEPPPESARDRSWKSRCAGWRGGVHEKARETAEGWVCRWCAQTFTPPSKGQRKGEHQ